MAIFADTAQLILSDPAKMMGLPRTLMAPYEGNFARLRVRLRAARRFKLNNDFIHEAVIAASAGASELLSRIPLAALPFENVWLEFDQNYRVDLQDKLGTSQPRAPGEDLGMGGYLLSRLHPEREDAWKSVKFAGTNPDKDGIYTNGSIAMTEQVLGHSTANWFSFQGKANAELSQMVMNDFMGQPPDFAGWGYKSNIPEVEATMATLRNAGGTGIERTFALPYMQDIVNKAAAEGTLKGKLDPNSPAGRRVAKLLEGIRDDANNSRGDLRFLITVLAMINVIPTEYVNEKPTRQKFTKHLKTLDYLDSTTVIIRPGRKRVITLLKNKQREYMKRRRHEVRGHWRVSNESHGDAWIAFYDHGRLRYRRWIEHHMRGDASLGFVRHDYEVKE